jgi:hypothetical protein
MRSQRTDMRGISIAIAAATVISMLDHDVAQARPAWIPMGQTALAALYSGKTWRWAHGAGYFAPDGQFKAWSVSKGVRSTARGTWEIRPDGVMCFSAVWQMQRAEPIFATPVVTCFEHQVNDGKIAQQKEPDGPWYLFKHTNTRQTDEVRKLVKGDRTHP